MTHEIEDHDRGLSFDLQTLMNRRRALALFAAAGATMIVGCGESASSSGPSASASGRGAPQGSSDGPGQPATANETVEGAIPEETAGPYPGDGSNGPNVLDDTGIVRSDIRSSLGDATGVAEGVPLTISMTVTDLDDNPLESAAVYVWHCNRAGEYSMYSAAIEGENYLRGVQAADADGTVEFTSIYPACYSGRWPHVHFEVYERIDDATSAGTPLATSQIALPDDACNEVYATAGYEQSVTNFSQVSLQADNVFGEDQAVDQMATMSGSIEDGYTAHLTVPVAT